MTTSRPAHPMHGTCVYCQARPAESRDHIIARSRGGVCKLGNRAWACHLCNTAKDSMTVVEWMFATARYVLTGDGSADAARWVDATFGGRPQAIDALMSGRPLLPVHGASEECGLALQEAS